MKSEEDPLKASILILALAATASAQRPAAAPDEVVKRFPPLRPIEIPEVDFHTLANGMELYLLEDRTLPQISGSATLRTGNLFDPADKIGLAGITGSVWRLGGTRSMTGERMDEVLEAMAASIETGIGETSGSVGFWTLTRNLDRVLEIFADVLTRPEFRQDKLDFALQQARGAIARRNDDASGIASREFRNLIYGRDTPYGWQIEYEHLDAITRGDLMAFYRRYVFPANVKLALYGDFSSEDMKARIEKAFAHWTVEQPPAPPFPAVNRRPEGGVFVVEKGDVNQTNIRIGHLGGLRDDDDYPALGVLSQILGGGFQSRLFQEVRSRLGLAYSVGASWGANYRHPGVFTLSMGTKSESTMQAVEAALTEVERIRSEPVSDQELQTAISSVLNGFVFNFDTRRKTLGRMMLYRYWDYPDDFIFRLNEKIARVTQEDIQRAAKKYLRPERFKIILVGKTADFDKPPDSLGSPVVALDIAIPEPKQEQAKADEASLARGRAVLLRAQRAAGGADKLAAVRDITRKVRLEGVGGQFDVDQVTKIIFPDVLWQRIRLPFGEMTLFAQGAAGWIKSPQGQAAMTADQIKPLADGLFRQRERLLLSDRGDDRTVNFVEESEVDSRKAEIIEISAERGRSVRLWVASDSGEILSESYRGVSMQGSPVTVVETHSDYREVDGILLPFKTLVEQDGRQFADLVVEEVIYNSGLDAEALGNSP